RRSTRHLLTQAGASPYTDGSPVRAQFALRLGTFCQEGTSLMTLTRPFSLILMTLTCCPAVITTVVGTGEARYSCGAIPASRASFSPRSLAFDRSGNLYIADWTEHAHRICKFGTTGVATTVAGNGQEGFSGDGGLAVTAALNVPKGVVVDLRGN